MLGNLKKSKSFIGVGRGVLRISEQKLAEKVVVSGRKYAHSQIDLIKSNSKSIARDLLNRVLGKVNRLDQKYERLTGIAQIRQMQENVRSAQRELLDLTEQSESCQRDLDELRDKLRTTREKIESAVRPSETFIKLIEAEEQLLKEEIALKSKLSLMLVKKERSMENFSRVLGLSHEVERTRQEKSRYIQLLYISISFVVYLMQKSWLGNESSKFEERLDKIEKAFLKFSIQELEDNQAVIKAQLNQVIDKLDTQIRNQRALGNHKPSWASYVPGLTTFMSWIRLS